MKTITAIGMALALVGTANATELKVKVKPAAHGSVVGAAVRCGTDEDGIWADSPGAYLEVNGKPQYFTPGLIDSIIPIMDPDGDRVEGYYITAQNDWKDGRILFFVTCQAR
jgi:hypothetical protein